MGNAGSGQVGGGDVGYPNHQHLSDADFSKQSQQREVERLKAMRGGPGVWRRGSAGGGAGGKRFQTQRQQQHQPPPPAPVGEHGRKSRHEPVESSRDHRRRARKAKKPTRPPVKVIRTHPVQSPLEDSHPEQDDDDEDDDDSFDDDSTITSRPDLFHVEQHGAYDDPHASPTNERYPYGRHNKHKPYFPEAHSTSPSSSGQHKLESHSERTSATDRESSGGGSSNGADRFVLSVRSPDGTYLPPLGRHATDGSQTSQSSHQQRKGASTPTVLPPLPLQTNRSNSPAVSGTPRLNNHNNNINSNKGNNSARPKSQPQFQPFEEAAFPSPDSQQQQVDFASFPAFTEDLFASSRGGAAPSVTPVNEDEEHEDDEDWPAPSFAAPQDTFDPFNNSNRSTPPATTTSPPLSISSTERQNLQQILQLTPEAQRALLAGGTASKSTQKLLEAVLDPNLAASVIAAATATQRAATPSFDSSMSACTPPTQPTTASPDPPTPHTHNKSLNQTDPPPTTLTTTKSSSSSSSKRSKRKQQQQQQQKKTQIEEPREILEKKQQRADRSDMSVAAASVFSASNRNFMEQCYQDSGSVGGDESRAGGGGGGGGAGHEDDDEATLTSMSTAAISTMSKSARSLGLRRRYRRTRQNPSRRSSRRWSSRSRIIVDENRAFEAMMHSGIIWADIPRPAKVTAVALTDFAHSGVGAVAVPSQQKKPLLMAVGTDDGCVAVMEVIDDGSIPPDPFVDPKKAAADKNNKVRRVREIHRDAKIRSLDFSPDGRFLAVAGDDCTAAIVDVGETPLLEAPADTQLHPLKVIQEISREDRICSAKFSPDGALLAMGGFDGMVAIALTGPSLVAVTEGNSTHAAPAEVVAEVPRLGLVLSVDWSPDGTMLAIGGSDKKVAVVVATSSSKSRGGGGGGSGGASVAPSIVGGKSLGAVSSVGNSSLGGGVSECSIAISEDDEEEDPGWEVLGEVPRSSAVLCARWSPDGKCLAVACQDGTVSVVDLESRKIVKEIRKGKGSGVVRPSLADGAIRTATGRSTGTVTTFGGLSVSTATGGGAGSNRINALCWSPDGSFLALGGCDDCCTIVETTSYVRVHEVPRSGHLMTVEWVGGGAAGPYLVTGGDDRAVAIVKTGGGNTTPAHNSHKNAIEPHVGTVTSAQQMDWVFREGAFTDAQELNALQANTIGDASTVSNSKEEVDDANQDHANNNQTALVIHSVAFSRNDPTTQVSQYLALAGSDGEVAVISTEHWGIEAELTLPCTVRSLKFSSDNRILALGGDSGCLYVVSVENWELLFELNTPHAILALNFSTDGRRLALGSTDGHLRMIGKEKNGTWGIVGEMGESSGGGLSAMSPILSLDWSSNGKHLAVGRSDGTVEVHNVDHVMENRFVPQAQISRGSAPVHTVAFGAGGKFLAVGGGDWTVAVYRYKSSWKLCHELKMDGWVQQVSWSHDGRYLGLGGTGLSRGAVVLDTISWEPVEELADMSFPASTSTATTEEERASLDWSQDGNWFVVAGLGGVSRVINVHTWEVAHSINHFVALEEDGGEEGGDEEYDDEQYDEDEQDQELQQRQLVVATSNKLVTINESNPAEDGLFFDPFGAQASAEGWTAFPSDDVPHVVDDEDASMAASFKFDASGRSSVSEEKQRRVQFPQTTTVDAMEFPPAQARKRREQQTAVEADHWEMEAAAPNKPSPSKRRQQQQPQPQQQQQLQVLHEADAFDRSSRSGGSSGSSMDGNYDLSAAWMTHETVKTFHDVSRVFLGRWTRESLPSTLDLFVQSVEMLRAHLKWALSANETARQGMAFSDDGELRSALFHIYKRATLVMQKLLSEANHSGWWITSKKYDVSVKELQRLKKWNDALRRYDAGAALVDINVLVLVDS